MNITTAINNVVQINITNFTELCLMIKQHFLKIPGTSKGVLSDINHSKFKNLKLLRQLIFRLNHLKI